MGVNQKDNVPIYELTPQAVTSDVKI